MSPTEEIQAEADNGGTVAIALEKVEPVQGEAVVAGEISGPALRFTVRFTNETDSAVNLDYAIVNAYVGADRLPAATVMQPGGAPLSGTLAAGESASGVYLFSIAEADRSDVLIGIDYMIGKPTVTFRGDFR